METILKIYQDSFLTSPREDCENFGTIVYKHSRYALGEETMDDPVDWLLEKLEIDEDRAYSLAGKMGVPVYSDQFREYLENRFSKNFVWLPLYLFDHSGITISTTGFSCPWDSGQIGYIYVSKEKVRKEFGNQTSEWRKKYHKGKGIMQIAKSLLECEIETFDKYLCGDVYGFKLFDIVDGEEEEIDACWGFYGDNWATNGMKDSLPEEVHEQLNNVEINY